MKKSVTLALTAVLLTSATPVVFAGDGVSVDLGSDTSISAEAGGTSVGVDAGVDAGVGLDVDDSGVSAGTGLDANAGASTDSSVSAGDGAGADASLALNSDADIRTAIDDVDSADDIRIVAWSDVQGSGSADLQVFNSADESAQSSLDGMIEANSTLVAALDAAGYDADQVVAIRSAADGSVKLYVDDRV